MKKILGLDIGTNSIGWALIEKDNEKKDGKILGLGCRIIPIGNDKKNFEQGLPITRNAERRKYRMARRRNERYKQRRNKLIYVLHKLEMLPDYIKIEENLPPPEKIQTLKIKQIPKGTKQLNALEIIELRKKALNEKIDLKELGRIIYLYNQLRGYAGGSIEEEENVKEKDTKEDKKNQDSEVFIKKVKILFIKEVGKVKSKKRNVNEEIPEYEITVETEQGEQYTGKTTIQNLNLNDEFELEINIKRNKKSAEKIDFKLPKKTDWRIRFEQLENEFKSKGNPHIAELFYEKLKDDPWYRIRNHLILRERYKREFDAIWDNQSKYYEFLNNLDKNILKEIAEYLFPGKSESQKKYREIILKEGLKYLIKEMIIYYQRPLKPQFTLISNCRFEKELKVIPQSHPLYQEYRIWQQINNLSINTVYQANGKKYYYDRPLTFEQKESLYEILNNQKSLNHNKIRKILELKDDVDYLNGLNKNAELKGNETLIILRKSIGQELFNKLRLNNLEKLTQFWRILYNWIKDDNEIINHKDYEEHPEKYNVYNPNSDNEYDLNSERIKKIKEFMENELDGNDLEIINEEILTKIGKIRFERKYGSLSSKAINNLLPLMRAGKYFNYNSLSEKIKQIIEKIKNAEDDESIDNVLREYHNKFPECFNNGGLMSSYAMILVYGRHTAEEFEGINDYHNIKTYEQRKAEDPDNANIYTLRNPIVEQILNETLQLVKSIWKQYKIKPDEIRIELVRELKNNAEERKKLHKSILKNEKENKKIKEKLEELKVPTTLINIEKYRLYEEQNKISPYTLKPIEISRLFSEDYQIDHIIPRSRLFDDSLNNKVVCEYSINNLKGNRTAWEFINSGDSMLGVEEYIEHINKTFSSRKRKNLLATKIPENFIERQKKDTQYITVKVKEELGKIVGTNNVKTTTGAITNYLSQQWGIKTKLKELTKERFELMENLIGEKLVEYITDEYGKRYLQIKEWSKRIDHRSHAVDALIVACTEQSHIQRLNNLNKEFQKYLKENKDKFKLENYENEEELLLKYSELNEKQRQEILETMPSYRNFELPWKNFPEVAEEKIKQIIVSHKPKPQLLIQKHPKTGEEYLKIRGALHEQTLYGKENTYRFPLSNLTQKKDIKKFIKEYVVCENIKNILLKHIEKYNNKPEEAFSYEGIEELNKNRKNKIKAIRVKYKKEEKEDSSLIPLYSNSDKIVYIKTGGNYCFAVADDNGVRKYGVISLFDTVKLVNKLFRKGEKNINKILKDYFENKYEETKNCKLLFTLSQNDLVYLPKLEENNIPLNNKDHNYLTYWKNIDRERIFRVVKFDKTSNICYFVSHNISGELKYKTKDNKELKEFGTYGGCSPYIYLDEDNKFHQNNQKSYKKNIRIQDYCIKIKIDRLGNVEPDILK